MSDETTEAHLPPGVQRGPETVRSFRMVLVNTLVANVTSSYLWFALTFWAYLETRSVLTTSIIGGAYMLLTALFGTYFGTLVDRNRKHRVMIVASTTTLVAYLAASALWLAFDEATLIDWGGPVFWVFVVVILAGGVVESLRNIALSTTVTLLVPEDGRDKANGLVGTVQGIAFMVTSVFSGLSVGLLGMGWTLALATILTGLVLVHLVTVSIPEREPDHDADGPSFDVKAAVAAIRSVPGLPALIVFTTFNNLVSGVYIALMDPYGLTLFSVESWGLILGVTGLGFVVGGGIIAKVGLGKNPVRTLLLANLAVAALGMTFTLREWPWLYVAGIFVFMALVPAAESAEQTILQRVVPFRTQGRVFGFAQSVELAASPISAFMIGPLAEFWLIPYMETSDGRATWGWLLGDGEARGIALVFLAAGGIMLVTVLLALVSRPYRRLSASYGTAPPQSIESAVV